MKQASGQRWDMLSFGGFMRMAAMAALSAVVMFAHHGSAVSYELNKRVTMKGVITDFKYINPHPALFWDVTDDKGVVTNWNLFQGPLAVGYAYNQLNFGSNYVVTNNIVLAGSTPNFPL